jgi:hypothetical protein
VAHTIVANIRLEGGREGREKFVDEWKISFPLIDNFFLYFWFIHVTFFATVIDAISNSGLGCN